MLERFRKDVIAKGKKEEMITVDLTKNPIINSDFCLEEIANNITIMDESTLYEYLIRGAYADLLRNIFEKRDHRYLTILSNSKFLNVFIRALNVINLTQLEKVYCNKIAYDYLTSPDMEKNKEIETLYLSMSRMLNKDIISKLLYIGLNENVANQLSLARYSSLKEEINVKRVNLLIIRYNKKIMDEQTIIKIYEVLFDSLSTLFIHTMFDIYTEEELKLISEDASEINSEISLAVIDILNNMPSDTIKKVLVNYLELYKTDTSYAKTRFRLRSISQDEYYRILEVFDILVKMNPKYDQNI